MFSISVYQHIQNTMLLSPILKLVPDHSYRHASRVHSRRSTTIRNRNTTKALYDLPHFRLDVTLVLGENFLLGKASSLPQFASLLPGEKDRDVGSAGHIP
jgi:hypothetical protein